MSCKQQATGSTPFAGSINNRPKVRVGRLEPGFGSPYYLAVDAETLAVFFALLLLAGAAGVAAAWLLPSVRAEVSASSLPLAAVVAAGAMGGSLYFSEGAGYVPCDLCWYQRFAMYPLAIGLAIAAVLGTQRVRRYAIAVAAAGLVVSVYHIQLQLFPEQSSFCEVSNPCSGRWVEAFGWMTIPQMAGLTFTIIIGLLALPRPIPQETP